MIEDSGNQLTPGICAFEAFFTVALHKYFSLIVKPLRIFLLIFLTVVVQSFFKIYIRLHYRTNHFFF